MTEKNASTLTAQASFVRIKELDVEHRVIEGVASSPATDRVGDVVVPTGAQFKLPIPLLIDHNHQQAVGEVEWARATATGIRFKARIAKIDKPGAAKDLVDYAWDLVRSGLRKTVSIGFRVLPGGYEIMPNGGMMFQSWEWFELSLVAIPANPDAQIESFKAHPMPLSAAKPHKPVRIKSKNVLDAEKAAKNKRSIVYLTAPAEREGKRIEQRITEIDQALKRLERQAYDNPYDHDLQKHVQAAQLQLEQERSFHRQRLVGLEAGLVEVTEKQVRAPLMRSATAPPSNQARGTPAATQKPKAWTKHVPSDSNEPWHKAADSGMERLQEVLSASGFGPDNLIRAATFKNIVGMAIGVASEAFHEVQAIKDRLVAIETAGIKFAGVWQRAIPYSRGNVVTHQGSAWVALREIPEGEAPGQAPELWQLMVKSGRDGKDADAPKKEHRPVKIP